MTHDPLCPVRTERQGSASTDPSVPTVDYRPAVPCVCDLIARVRADERWRIIGVMERNADGDAIKVIDAVLDML